MENRNWKEYKFEEIMTITSSKRIFYEEYVQSGVPFYRSKEIIDLFNRREIQTELFISEKRFDEIKNKFGVPRKDDILLTSVGSLGIPYLVKESDRFYFKDGNLTWLKDIDSNILHPVFIYKWITSQIGRQKLEEISIGSTQAALTISALKSIDIQLPPLPEQKAIASVLSSLDDKIDLLHQQNQTLEAFAETLYLNFIDEREFNSKLSDIFSLQNGYAFKSKSFKESGTIRVIKIKNISGDIVDITNSDFVDDESIKKLDFKFKINSGDILIAMTGAEVGKLGIVPETDQSLWLNQRVGLLKEKFEGAKYLAYLHLKSDFGQDYIENTATGSAQPNISGEGIENCEFPLYEETELREICNKLSPLYDKVIFNLGQIHTLTQMRDTLLPKLMSGEVRVEMQSQN